MIFAANSVSVRSLSLIHISWVTQGVSMEMVFDLNKDIKAKDIYDTLITAWEESCKSVYYIRTIQKNTNSISDKEECESCSG